MINQLVNLINAYREVAEELAERIKGLAGEERVSRLARDILKRIEEERLSTDEILSLLYLVARDIVLRYSVESEHPCHCDPGRVSMRIVLALASITKLVYDYAAGGEAEKRCREYQERFCTLPAIYA